jgi:hypothetical protein
MQEGIALRRPGLALAATDDGSWAVVHSGGVGCGRADQLQAHWDVPETPARR